MDMPKRSVSSDVRERCWEGGAIDAMFMLCLIVYYNLYGHRSSHAAWACEMCAFRYVLSNIMHASIASHAMHSYERHAATNATQPTAAVRSVSALLPPPLPSALADDAALLPPLPPPLAAALAATALAAAFGTIGATLTAVATVAFAIVGPSLPAPLPLPLAPSRVQHLLPPPEPSPTTAPPPIAPRDEAERLGLERQTKQLCTKRDVRE